MKYNDLSLSLEQKTDRVCADFESAWKTGVRPRIEDFLGELHDTEKPDVLPELVLLDVWYSRRHGGACSAQEYQKRFPELSGDWLKAALTEDEKAAGDRR
jgi:eukaryotic-like serine/threonine-protein kinase